MTTITNLSLIILSGGQGRRMGGVNKGIMRYKGQLMIDRILEQVSPLFNDIVLVTNSQFELFEQRCLNHPQLQIISDQYDGFKGPLAGIHSGLQQTKHQYSFLLPCDAPGPYNCILQKLQPHLNFHHDVIIPHDGERLQPLFSIVHKNLINPLDYALKTEDLSVLKFFNTMNALSVNMTDCQHCFKNLNTPKDTES